MAPELAIAFDVPSLDEALALDARLGEGPEYAKVGLQLFAAAGPGNVQRPEKRLSRSGSVQEAKRCADTLPHVRAV